MEASEHTDHRLGPAEASEISLLIFFTSENVTFRNMHIISSIFFCISLICI